jgi:FecR protein
MLAMSHFTSRLICAIGVSLAMVAPARAQYGVATLTHADGGVTRQHRGAPAATTVGVSIMDGDSIETINGRAEVSFLDGTIVHLDRDSAVIVLAGDRVRMLAGRVSLRTSGSRAYIAEAASSKIHVQTGSVIEMTAQAGRPDATVRIVSGKARVENAQGSSQVPDYHKVYLAGASTAPAVTKVIPAPADEFERWALTRLVMASSTPLKGTEFGGGVAYSPYGYGYGYYGYSYYPSYSYTRYNYVVPRATYYVAPIYTYSTPYYASPYYGPTYYSSGYSSGYAPNYPAGYSANYYSATPIRSYYGANYGTASSYATPTHERFTYTPPTSTAPTPAVAPGTTSTGAPLPSAPGSIRGTPVPKP